MAHFTFFSFFYSWVYRDLFMYLARVVPYNQKANSSNQSKIILNLKTHFHLFGVSFFEKPNNLQKYSENFAKTIDF